MKRLSWDEFFVLLALAYSTRGTCDRLKTACILVKDKKLVAAGYNGSISGLPHCDEVGHLMIDEHCVRTLHGEDNAHTSCPNPELLRGASSYNIGAPCLKCVKMLLQAGVRRFVYILPVSKTSSLYSGMEHEKTEEWIAAKEMIQSKGGKLVRLNLEIRNLIERMVEILESPGGALCQKS